MKGSMLREITQRKGRSLQYGPGNRIRRREYGSSELQKKTTCARILGIYEGWNFNSGNYLFTTDTK